jgi:hypothetical protein
MKPSAWLVFTLIFTPCLAEIQNVTATPTDAPDKQGDYNAIIHHFFAMVKAGKCTDAAHVLIDTNPQDSFNVEKHEALAVPLEKIQDALGSFKEFKPIVTKTFGDSVGYVYGLAIYERDPIRFEFMFYKDGPDWRLLHIDFNLNYVSEIRDLAGVHIQVTPSYAPAPAQPAPAVKPKTPDNPEPLVPSALSNPVEPSSQPTTAPVPSPAATPPASAPAPSPTPKQ